MILMYHHVAPRQASPPSHALGYLSITPEALEKQLCELMDRGFRFVRLESMVAEIEERGYVPRRTAAVTLDDGWADNYQYAFPIFQRLNLSATFFITTSHLRGGADLQGGEKMRPCEIIEIHKYGMSVGGHTRTHADLLKLTLGQVREEIRGCKLDIENLIGAPATQFAYPGGGFNREIARIVREVGYTAACSVIGLGIHRRSSLFWLYRDVLTDEMNTLPDIFRLHRALRVLMLPRTWRRTQEAITRSSVL
jgi:peptidoglycan/xylan/chitin deacetylase (PgdA/CDA1 family)